MKHVMTRFTVVVVSLLLLAESSNAAENYDIVIYGGTSGAITAAVQAKKMGKSVVIVAPEKHLGGLTTGGLGATDIGNKAAIGGLSREFYHRIWLHYQKPESWKQETLEQYIASRRSRQDPRETTMWTFEPKAAEKVYDDWLMELNIPVVRGERLDLKNGVKKQGAKITEIAMESGKSYAGKMFIDVTYEGDLMAKAGVAYHVGRESNDTYEETLNGWQPALNTKLHRFVVNVDPYIQPGDKSSGLLPGIRSDTPPAGSGDKGVQAYNFRLCTTDVPENRRAWEKPANYDPMQYELLLRNFEAGDNRSPWNPIWMPNRKTDTNNNCAVSTDWIGFNHHYAEADYATREKIWKAHREYTMGLGWTIANSPRVTQKVRDEWNRLALAKDEFVDNDNWPYQMYVREARRMISEYVMTEANCRGSRIAEDSVGMGAYGMDSHNVWRYVTPEGFVQNEGDIQVHGFSPYPISYRSIVPDTQQCTNLLVPVCLSASHIAYGSIRMEPVFMVLGQSAATAASMAIDANSDVQKVDYAKLKERLVADGQALTWTGSRPSEPRAGIDAAQLKGVVIDDSKAVLTGEWTGGTSISPWVGAGYRHDGNEAKGSRIARYETALSAAGRYEVRISYSAHDNRATNVPVTVKHRGGEAIVKVNQKSKPAIDGAWQSLGAFEFSADQPAVVTIGNAGTDGHVIIDAVQFVPAQ